MSPDSDLAPDLGYRGVWRALKLCTTASFHILSS